MKFDREAFCKLLDHACSRPGMYVGARSFHLVFEFLASFDDGVRAAQGSSHLQGFDTWLKLEHRIFNPAWGALRILVHRNGTYPRALAAFPSDVRLFWRDIDELGLQELERRTREMENDPTTWTSLESTWPSSTHLGLEIPRFMERIESGSNNER